MNVVFLGKYVNDPLQLFGYSFAKNTIQNKKS